MYLFFDIETSVLPKFCKALVIDFINLPTLSELHIKLFGDDFVTPI